MNTLLRLIGKGKGATLKASAIVVLVLGVISGGKSTITEDQIDSAIDNATSITTDAGDLVDSIQNKDFESADGSVQNILGSFGATISIVLVIMATIFGDRAAVLRTDDKVAQMEAEIRRLKNSQ